jgi:hypothetical protein
VLAATVCRMHGGCAPQLRRAARRALADAAATRLLASMRGDFRFDGRIGPREYSPYGLLPPSRRETYLADRARLDKVRDGYSWAPRLLPSDSRPPDG